MKDVLPLLLILAPFVMMLGVIYFTHRMKRPQIRSLASALGGSYEPCWWRNHLIAFERSGIELWLEYAPGGKSRPARMKLCRPGPAATDLTITRNSLIDRMSTLLMGLGSPVLSGDAAFDEAYRTLSPMPLGAASLLEEGRFRTLIDQLFERDCTSVALDQHQGILVIWLRFSLTEKGYIRRVAEAAELLADWR